MNDAILVLNAGSSTIKFSLFGKRDAALVLVSSGQVGEITTAPTFVAKDAEGEPMAEKRRGPVPGSDTRGHWPT